MPSKKTVKKKLVDGAINDLRHYMGPKAAREMSALIEENKALRFAGRAEVGQIDFSERTRYGDQWQQTTMSKYLGEFNPDSIPLVTYDKMRWDGQLRLGLATIKMPIMSRGFEIHCEDKDIQAFVYQNMREIWRPFIKSVLSALDFGFAPHEKIWEIAENYRVISKDTKINYTRDAIKYRTIKDVCQHTITMDYSEGMKFKGFFQNKNRPGREAYVPASKAFIFTHDKEWGNIYGWSRLKPAYPYWYTYWILDAWHERWLQKRGIPPIIVKYPIGKSQTSVTGGTVKFKDNADIARDTAKSLQPDSIVTIPSDETKTLAGRSATWDISTLVDNTKIDAFVMAKEKLDIRKLRAILVPERAITQDTSTGSFKMAESHIWLMMESLKGLIGDVADHTNEFLIPQLVKVNFGDRSPRATIKIEEVGKELTNALFEIYLGLIQTGRANPGVKKMEAILNIPSETDEEKTEREEYEKKFGVPTRVSGDRNKRTIKGEAGEQNRMFSGTPLENSRGRMLSSRVSFRLDNRDVDRDDRIKKLKEDILRKKLGNLDEQGRLITKLVGST